MVHEQIDKKCLRNTNISNYLPWHFLHICG